MKIMKTEIFLPLSIDQAWDFFSSPKNLNIITPDDMNFKITSFLPNKIYKGLFITYKISPVFKIPIEWITEITQIEENKYFIDEQRKGPYKIWHHEHHFKELNGGVLMTDLLFYEVGSSFLGWLASKLWVDKKVNAIFKYREQKLISLFPLKK